MNECDKSCFNCACVLMKPTEFVQDAKCMHPVVKRAMRRKGVTHLDPDKMSKGCPNWTQYKDQVVDPMKDAIAHQRKRERKQAKASQLSLL